MPSTIFGLNSSVYGRVRAREKFPLTLSFYGYNKRVSVGVSSVE